VQSELLGLSKAIPQTRASIAGLSPGAALPQTLEVQQRKLSNIPLYPGAAEALDVLLIDTPGYGDLVVGTENSFAAVTQEVESRIREHNTKRAPAREGLSLDDEKVRYNPLVHVCLFFIGPHRMKRNDIDLMRKLHDKVPLVVVVAKADTMTTDETRDYKSFVSRKLSEEQIETFRFESKAIRQVESHQQQHWDNDEPFNPLYGAEGVPWAVIGAQHGTGERRYKWGTAQTTNPSHSELPALRDLVLRFGGWKSLKEKAARKADLVKAAEVAAEAKRAEEARMAEEKKNADQREMLLKKRKPKPSCCAMLFGFAALHDEQII